MDSSFLQRLISTAALLLAGYVLMVPFGPWPGEAFAQSSLGLGGAQGAIRPEGPFAGLLFWIQQQQQVFYRAMTSALRAIRDDGSHVLTLSGLSFAYGVFHAAGPGHGKAVISSYMIANEVAARRGIALAFASAFAQALTAILLIGAVVLLLRGTGIRQGDLTRWLEIASYSAVSLLGLWLLVSKLRRSHAGHDHSLAGANDDHGEDGCCDHLHAPDPSQLTGSFDLRKAWGAILAVGLRPCTGAIIVLTFAFLNGLFFAGIASTLAMALGTGLTVAILAAIAVWSKDLAVRFGGQGKASATIHRVIEISGALLVLALGLLLLSASLSA